MWSLSLVVSECSLIGRGQGHVSNFYIVDFLPQQVVGIQVIYTIRPSSVCLWHLRQWEPTRSCHGRVHIVHDTLPRLNLQLHTISLVRTCRISSFCTVALQLARLLLTRCITRSLCDSRAFWLLFSFYRIVLVQFLFSYITVTLQNLLPQCDHHFVGITCHNVCR